MRPHASLVVVELSVVLLLAGAAIGLAGQGSAPTTLTRPVSAEQPVAADGFIQRWLVLEPIAANGLTDSAVRAAVSREYFSGQLTVVPHDGDTVTVSDAPLAWHAIDTTRYNVNLHHFATGLRKPTSNVLFWVVTVVQSPGEQTGVRLAIGSNAASIWWVNGQEVISIFGDRQAVIDDGVSKRLTLKKGPNVVRAAVINGGGATDFCARFLDANERPMRDLRVSLPGAR